MHPEEPHAPLPRSVQEIADVIGRAQALTLVASLPRGRREGHPSGKVVLYVPRNLPKGHRLVSILGEADARRLCETFGSEILYIAVCKQIERARRNAAIREAMRRGDTHDAIAKACGITARQVRNIVRENPPKERAAAGMQHAA